MSGVERVVKMGSMAYVDPEGRLRRAEHGTTVEVHPDHVARFDRLNRPQTIDAEPVAEVKAPEPPEVDAVEDDETDDEKPARTRRASARKES
ncbi:hypothetical protein GV791_14865 [Nocardia cyriacigeorgica]|uniref:Uncharacterized protein n=1 Tax=Nocardia cyriacigeorgica TaxID=135487 RepID=A0A6P1CPK7_9NOCA|nr:hypothetical protein [Nocardia cyriacigeorgica]NEW33837.1 hypothetical protein [Nocardia cyriacigeorgica]